MYKEEIFISSSSGAWEAQDLDSSIWGLQPRWRAKGRQHSVLILQKNKGERTFSAVNALMKVEPTVLNIPQ